ncbi:hypothetical protein PRNP1_006089 [Phytophthora ramorum]
MAEKCLRNASCTCSMCAGFDVASLMSISKSISSNIQYEDEDGAGGQQEAPPAPKFGGVANSPIPAPRKALVSSSPPLPAARSQPQATEDVLMDVKVEGVAISGAAPVVKTPAAEKEVKKVVQHTNMDAVATTLSNMEVVNGGLGESVSMDEVLPKLTDKNWKVRKEAFEELKAVFEQPGATTERARPAMGLFTKMCEDSNASAMEAGIAAVLAYTLNVQPFEKEIVSGVMARVTDKGFSARPGIVKLCEELVDAFIAAGAAEETVIALLEGTSNRKPKVPPACLTCTLEALKAYGPRVVPLQAIKSALPKLMEGAVKVRQISMDIMVEIHRWTGPALVQDVVANLRSAQQTEFEGQVKDVVPGQAAPTKFVKGAKPAKAAGGGKAAGAASGAAEPAPAAFDPRDFAETVDLLAKLPKTEFKTKLALPKWSEKVEALKIVLEVIGPVPKLANGDYYELVSTLKALTNDSNVNIVAKSIELFGALADGLRKNFTQYARTMFSDLLRKLSDKKSVILSATNKTLDMFLQHAMPIDMMMDDLKLACDASKNKAPPARVQTMAFVARAVENRYVDVNDKALIVAFGLMFMKGVNDTDPKVREAGQKSYIVLLTATDQTVGWLQSQMDEIARKNPRAFKTIQRGMGGGATSAPPSRPGSAQSSRPGSAASSRPGSAPPSRPSSAGSSASRSSFGGSNAPALDDEDVDMASPAPVGPRRPSLKKRGPPARLGVKPGAAPKAAPSRRPLASGAAASGGGSAEFTPMAISVTAEEAEGVIADLQIENWGPIQEGFASSKWMERKEAIEGLEEFSKAQSSMMSMRIIEAFTMYLSSQVKDFKDSNINVLKSSFQAVGTFAKTAASKFPRGVVCLLVPRACDKIGDRKANEAVTNMIMQFCEATSPSYTTGCMIEYMPQVRTPLAHIEALKVLSDCVKDFGISICNPRALIDFAKGPLGLESSNPKVRSAAISLLSTMYSQLGPALLPILNLESWKPALAAAVESEFKKVGFDPTKAMASVKRQVKDQDEASAAADPGALFGRVDVSSQITKELLGDMKNESDKVAWKKRAEAMDTVQSICESAGCAIEFTRPVQEVLRGLKARLNDSNANLKVKATNVIAIVATSVGPDIAKMSKILGASLIAGVADNKKTMQAASIQTLHKWVCHNDETSSSCMESLLNPLSEGLANTVGRAELLGWASEHLQNSEKLDLNCLVAPTVQCMMDKSSEAREKAQLLLVEVMKSVGKDTVFTTGCRDIKPAAMRALKPLLQKVCDAVEASGAATSTNQTSSILAPSAAPTQPPPAPFASGHSSASSGIARGGIRRRASASAAGGPPAPGLKSRLTRPSSFRAPTAASEMIEKDAAPLLKMSSNKSARIAKGQYNKWIFEVTSVSEMNSRKGEVEAEWKPFLSPEFHAKLFAPSLEKGMLAAMDDLRLCVLHQADEVVSSLDLIFKWCSLRIVDNNVQALAKLLEVLIKLFEMLKDTGYQLDDVEAAIILPYLLQESGQSKPRFRVRFRDVMKLIVDVCSPEKYVPYLMECFNGSKNMKSRCECIDLVEYIVSIHGYHVIGRKCIKDVGKYVVAHEKELRESAINTLVAVYVRTEGGNPDKFFRLAGITTQQGIDLLNARLKHLPASSLPNGNTALAEQEIAPEQEMLQQQQRTGFGFGFARTPATTVAAPINIFSQDSEGGVSAGAQPIAEPIPKHGVKPYDDDIDMNAPNEEMADGGLAIETIQRLLLDPIKKLVDTSKQVVRTDTPEYKESVNALKGLYAIISRPSDPSEVEFLNSRVNDIIIALCDAIHGAFYAGDTEKRPEMFILAISIATLTAVFKSDVVTNIDRSVVERVLLELCSKIMDDRMVKFSDKANLPDTEISAMSPEDKRYLMVFKSLYKAMRVLTERARPGDVYPSVINLLQRLLHNGVGDYNKNGSLKHLQAQDSLDQLVGRILLKLSNVQANSLHPFEGIDIYGVLMQMQTFFSTLPKADAMLVNIANDYMRQALKIMSDSLMKTRPGDFEESMKAIPPTSQVRDILEDLCHGQSQQQVAAEPTSGFQYGENGSSITNTAAPPRITTHFGSNGGSYGVGNATGGGPGESINRRLFDAPRENDIVTRTARTASAAPSLAGRTSVETRGRNITLFNDYTTNRGVAATNDVSRPAREKVRLAGIQERLQQMRHF